MEILKYAGVALLLLAVVLTAKKHDGGISRVVTVMFSVAALRVVLGRIFENTGVLSSLFAIGDNGGYGKILLKAVGIALVGEVSYDVCATLGENGIGDKVLLLAKGELLYLALPLIKELIDLTKNIAE